MSIILLIEDDKYIRESLEEFLTNEGYSVLQAANGVEAFALLEAGKRPHLIMLDLMMPVMDGFQFRERQLAASKYAGIPVVVMSAYGDLERNKETLRVEAYLKKPIDIDEILPVVERWCLTSADNLQI